MYDSLERYVPVFLSLQQILFNRIQNLVKRRFRIDETANHLGIIKKTDEVLAVQAMSVGNRSTNNDIGLSRVSAQEALIDTEKYHGKGGVCFRGNFL